VRSSTVELLTITVLATVLAGQAWWFAATTSGTPDETTYLHAALNVYHRGDFRALADDGIAPLPVLVSFAAPAWLGLPGYAMQILAARAAGIALIGLSFVVIMYVWLRRSCGRLAACAGTLFIVCSPNIIAHTALATTDICFVAAALAALLALVRYVEARSTVRLAWLAAALGAALSAKYSAIALFPATAIVLATADHQHGGARRRAATAVAMTSALFVAALLVAWALHGFTLAPTRIAGLGSHRVPAAVAGILSQAQHQRGGHPAFLLGHTSGVGWWYYMPLALALKSTPAELLVIAAALAFVVTGRGGGSPSTLTWRVTLATFGAFALINRLDLGIRYVLILPPLLLLVAFAGWQPLTRRGTLAYGVLLASQVASAASIAPYYLSYFNRFAGGPATGYRLLADSNIDWGQDLPALREALARAHARMPLVSYFGNAPFEEYGVIADPWDGNVQHDFDRWDWIAISATHLDGLFVPGDVFAPFRELTPSDRAGYSILMYSTERPDVRAAMADTARRWREVR